MVPSNSMIGRSPSLQASSTSSPTTAAIFSDGQPERFRDLGGLARRGFRIGRAHIGDDLDAFGGAERQHRAHPLFQQRIVAAFRILHPRLLRQRHRALAETFEHQILDIAFFGEFDRGLDAIARIAGAGSYSNGSHVVSIGDRAHHSALRNEQIP